jgi:hypothetical protein
VSKQSDFLTPEQFAEQEGSERYVSDPAGEAKKAFVEPEITTAADVLEATTFFMSTTSGATN